MKLAKFNMLLTSLVVIYSCVYGLFYSVSAVFPALLVIIQISLLLYKYRRSLYLIVSLAFVLAYPLVFIGAKIIGIPYHYILDYQREDVEYILFSAMSVFFLFFFNGNMSGNSLLSFRSDYSTDIASLMLVLAALISLLGVAQAWPPLLTNYGVESRSSQLFEYSLIFFASAVVLKLPRLSNNPFSLYNLLFIFTLLIVFLSPLLFGRRGPAMMYFWLFLVVFTLNYRIKVFHLVAVALFILFIRMFALLRAGSDLTLANFVFGSMTAGAMSNHQGGVIVSSVTYLGLVEDGIWGWADRFNMALGSLFAFLPYTSNPFPEAFIHRYVQGFANIPGSGGFPFVYAYLWGGLLMVSLVAYCLRRLVSNEGLSITMALVKLVVLAMFPRWYAYTLPVLIKFIILSFFLGLLLDLLLRKKK